MRRWGIVGNTEMASRGRKGADISGLAPSGNSSTRMHSREVSTMMGSGR